MRGKPLYHLLGYSCYRSPTIGQHLWPAFDHLERRRHKLLSRLHSGYTDKSPTHIINIDPKNITYCKKIFNSNSAGKVIGGDWDEDLNYFKNNDLYKCLIERYVDDKSWGEIEYVNNCIERVKSGETAWQNCNSVEEIHEHCKKTDRLYQSIEKCGVLEPVTLLKNSINVRPYNIPKINIGRSGELILNSDGTHRMAIAKILGLVEIPVWVYVRHKQWQRIRNQISNNNLSQSPYSDHPDMSDLINNTLK